MPNHYRCLDCGSHHVILESVEPFALKRSDAAAYMSMSEEYFKDHVEIDPQVESIPGKGAIWFRVSSIIDWWDRHKSRGNKPIRLQKKVKSHAINIGNSVRSGQA